MIAGDVNTHPQGELTLDLFEEERAEPTRTSTLVRFAPSTLEYIDPTPDDVLCGKDKATFEHEGNQRFREVVLEHASQYVFCDTQSERVTLVRSIAELVKERGGRFIKKDEDSGRYYEINERMSREKVRQALRFAGISKDKKNKQTKANAASKVFREAKRHLQSPEAREYLDEHGWMKFLTNFIPSQKKAARKKDVGAVKTNSLLSSMEQLKGSTEMQDSQRAVASTGHTVSMTTPLPSLENHHLSGRLHNSYVASMVPQVAFPSFTGGLPCMPPQQLGRHALPAGGTPTMSQAPHESAIENAAYGYTANMQYPLSMNGGPHEV